ncbi:MAG: TRAP transporter fused permease subunit [Chloroflexales bacterium]|nr:TRAP transporter fused permease subunit [Chloroflexales bacterium]
MTNSAPRAPTPASVGADETFNQEQVSQIIEEYESESSTRKLSGWWAWGVGGLAGLLSVYALYWTQYTITTQVYRASFLLLVLVLTFCYYPMFKRDRQRIRAYDLALGLLAVVSLVYLILNFRAALQRVTQPTITELVMGTLLLALVLEATRRTTGWALTIVAFIFVAYGFLGPYVPEPFDHRGLSFQRLIGTNYLTLQGVFGVPLDVAATFIVLFTIYGAVLEYSGAGKFFLDWSFAALGKSKSGSGPGRTVTAAGFLLGTVSGSGVATTVTLGSLAWPMLKRAGYERDTAGGMLSAAGIGATLSPPTLGAAAFLIAEYLDISYLEVLVMACIPTALYYLSILLMIEADSRRMGTQPVAVETMPLRELTLKYGYHFSSLFAIAILMALNITPFMAVFWSIVLAFCLSFLQPETRLTSFKALAAGAGLALLLTVLGAADVLPNMRFSNACFWGMMLAAGIAALLVLRRKLQRDQSASEDSRILQALEYGGRSVVPIAATTACAGIIVSVVTLTGLGLKISGLIVGLGGGAVFATIVFAAIAIWVLGLAVPVTASYILGAVMIVPALEQVGVPRAAAHMFIFYYAVLADVSPPTALAPMAAAAITGGRPFRTMMMAWKYCLPAFLVPFMFTLTPEGSSLLLLLPTQVGATPGQYVLPGGESAAQWLAVLAGGAWLTITLNFATACVAVAALAVTFGGWCVGHANLLERMLMGVGGMALLYPNTQLDIIGAVLLVIGLLLHVTRVRRVPVPA